MDSLKGRVYIKAPSDLSSRNRRQLQERVINYSAPIASSGSAANADALAAGRLPRFNDGTWEFPVLHVRGGTSTGLVIWDRAAPKELELREELLRHLMGLPLSGTSADAKQITGLGRGYPTSNKVFFCEMTTTESGGPRIVSTLAQLAHGKSQIDWSVNCGNMSAALPFWAIDQRFLPRELDGNGEIEIYNTNTKATMTGRVTLAGDGFAFAQIPGVDGEFPGVDLFMANPVGAKTGKALPTGNLTDRFGDYTVSCVDVAVPMVIARASEFGKTGTESVKDLRGDDVFFSALKKLWIEAGLKMGLTTKGRPMTAEELANSETIPKVCIVGAPVNGGNISTRYFTPQEGHATMAVTGGCCLAAACLMPGTVAHELAHGLPTLTATASEVQVDIENPAGILSATIGGSYAGGETKITRAAYKRSAQILLRGCVPVYRASAALKQALSETANAGGAK